MAQNSLPLLQGDRIRLAASVSPQPELECTGRFLEARRDTLVAQCWLSGRKTWEEVSVPLQSLRTLEVSQGKKSNVGKGAWVGALVGAGFGLALGVAVMAEDDSYAGYGAGAIPLGMLGGAFWGTAIGVVIGALTPGERWAEVPLESIRMGPAAAMATGFSIRISLHWP
jgi:hypothetical protein